MNDLPASGPSTADDESPHSGWSVSAPGSQGVQIGPGGVQYNTFNSFLPAVEVSWPVRVGVIPPLADCYQTRPEVAQLDRIAAGGATAVLTQVLAGLGGVGKSQLAAHHAHTHASGLDILLWVDARSPGTIVTAYARAAALLGLPGGDDLATAAQGFLAWLQANTERSWLVVLDDLVDPADMRGWWPAGARGSVIVTTRRTDAALFTRGRARIPVGIYPSDQALAYLAQKLDTTATSPPMREAELLVADLGCLPLALAQAAAFMVDRGDTCADYRQRFTDRRARLADLFPDDALADDYRHTVAATWSISVEAADHLAPAGLARRLLDLASLLDPNGFPTTLLNTSAISDHLTADTHSTHSERDIRDGLRNLARFSLVTLTTTPAIEPAPDNPVGGFELVRVHALVQRATHDQLPDARRGPLVRIVGDALLQAWPEIERDTTLAQILRANATTLLNHNLEEISAPGIHPLAGRLGSSLGDAGLVHAAIAHCATLHAFAERILGPDHPDTLNTRRNLAHWRGEAGELVAAAAAYEQLLDDQLRVLGPDHPATLRTRFSLACSRVEAGDPAGAVAAFELLLDDEIRVLGPDHTYVLNARQGLARSRGAAGDPAGAVAAFELLLDDEIRVLGPDDPTTLITRQNLAHWLGMVGNAADALATFEQLLTDQIRVLGPDHPTTFTTRQNLAYWRGEVRDATDALATFEQLLDDQLRVLGPDHPHTLTTRHHLARWRGEAGEMAAAAAAFEQLLTDRLRVLGPDHPDTLTTRSCLAYSRGEAGDATGAAAAYEQLLDDRVRVLGPDHPKTINTCYHLAHWRGGAGDAAGAAAATEQLLYDRVRVLGPDHPDTLTARHDLAYWRGEAGDPAGAVAAYEQLRTDQMRVLGPDHPDTLTTRHILAHLSGTAGDAAGAAAATEQLLYDRVRVLGPDHPDSLDTRHYLAHWRGQAGDAAGAAAAYEQLLTDQVRVLGPDHPDTHITRRHLAYWRGQCRDATGRSGRA